MIRVPLPLLTISNDGNAVTEGDEATFTISADADPKRDLVINFTPENIGNSDYLKIDKTSVPHPLPDAGEMRSVTIPYAMFTGMPTNNPTEWVADFTIPTRMPNNKDENHGAIKVTLNAAPTNNPYEIDTSSDDNSAMVTVNDKDVPKISIESTVVGDLLGGRANATFKLSSPIEPLNALVITYIPTNGPPSPATPGNFLDPMDPVSNSQKMSGDERMTESLTFDPATGNVPPYTASFTVPTQDDRTNATGQIIVTLVDDTGDKAYTLSDTIAERSATVSVIQVPHPLITISDAITVNEGADAIFTISADADPKRDLTINYTPSNVGEGDFLKVDSSTDPHPLPASGMMRSVDIPYNMFIPMPDPNPTEWVATISIPTRMPNDKDESHGAISVTLNDAPTDNPYRIDAASDDNSAMVTVNDADAPEISITNADETLAGDEIMFTLTASIEPLNNLEIRFTPTEANAPSTTTPTNFLDPTDPVSNSQKMSGEIRTSAELDFSGDSAPYTAVLKISTRDDPNAVMSSISVVLQPDDPAYTIPTYTITTDNNKIAQNTGTVTVIDKPNPTLSIAYTGSAIDEGQDATFTITATEDPKRDLTINFTPENNTGGDYLKIDTSTVPHPLPISGQARAVTIAEAMFTPNDVQNPTMWTAPLTIETRTSDDKDANHGSIKVTLNAPTVLNDYTVSNVPGEDNDTVIVHDDEDIEISILPASSVQVGADAQFTLETNIEPWNKDIEVHFNPVNGTNEFLDDENDNDHDTGYTSGRDYKETITFVADTTPGSTKYFGTLEIPTKDDPDQSSGRITVTIRTDDTVPADYVLATDTTKRSASVSVNNYPTLSIAHPQTSVDEGSGTTNFVVTSSFNPNVLDGSPATSVTLSVNYSITETGISNLHSSITPGAQTPIDLVFTQVDDQDPLSPWTANIPVQLRNADNINKSHGEVTVALAAVSDTATYEYKLAAPELITESITIRDADIPEISIADAPDTFNGRNAVFILTSDIEVQNPDFSIKVKPTETSTSFLEPTPANPFVGGVSGAVRIIPGVTFSRTDQTNTSLPFTYTLEIPTKIDSTALRLE